MEFKSKVLSKVQEVTKSKVSFCNGTLYVEECSIATAGLIKQALKSVTNCGVHITQIGCTGKVAFDFLVNPYQ